MLSLQNLRQKPRQRATLPVLTAVADQLEEAIATAAPEQAHALLQLLIIELRAND